MASTFATLGNDLYTGRRSINFVGRRTLWYLISAVLIGISLLGVFGRGLHFSLEFTGGTELKATGVSNIEGFETRARDAVREAVDDEIPVTVTKVGSSTVRVQSKELGAEGTGDALSEQARTALASEFGVSDDQVTSSYIGPSWGKSVTNKALWALGTFMVLVSLILALYFRTWKMSFAALVALLHDLIFTVGVYSLLGLEISPASVIGFLTILGYSLYDTVVVFDKVRENTADAMAHGRHTFGQAANHAVNQTLVRSINTTVVGLLPVGAILLVSFFLLGPGTLLDLSLALFVGMAVGAYSSIFIASPVYVALREREPEIQEHDRKVLRWQAEHGGIPEWTESAGAVTGADVPGGATSVGAVRASASRPSSGSMSAHGGNVVGGTGAVGTIPTENTTVGGRPLHPHARSGPRNQPKRPPKSKR